MSLKGAQNREKVFSKYAPQECQPIINGQQVKIPDIHEYVDVKEQTGHRKLVVPSREPVAVPKLLTKNEFGRLKQQAHVVTLADRMAIIDEQQEKRIELEEQSKMRKLNLEKARQTQTLQPGAKLQQVERAAKIKNLYLLKRAFDLRQEQEDEVKKANQLILASKCLAIRAAQVKEKELIARELDEEEKRLCAMMDEHRRRALDGEEEKKKKEKILNQRFVNEQKQQIKEKEIEKIQEGERIEEESKMQNRAQIQMQKDEEEKRQKKLCEQAKMREDLKLANQEIAKYRQIEKEEQRIADLRVQEFMRKKADREAALEEEKMLQKIAKEKEIARLRALQEKAADQQAAQDELNALRVQEEVEKEWRRKEKAAAEKKLKENAQLKIARQKQIDDIRKLQAVEIERERQDFYKVVEVQKESLVKELEKRDKKWKAAMQHRKDILQQVNEKERARIIERKGKFAEAEAIRAERELRTRYITDTLRTKMKNLRASKVPEPVVKDIERQLKLTS